MQSKTKSRFKIAVDICMTILLLCLMAYQVTGETLHEWIGIGMTVLLIVHHVLNIRWYGALFKGKYNTFRTLTTVVNTLLLAAIVLTAVCGISMSSHAVPFLYGLLPVSFARSFHLAMSFWSFILMGLHLGLHLPAMTAKIRLNKAARILLITAGVVIAGVGLGCFLQSGIQDYIFFRTPFAFLDYDKPAYLVFLENLAELFFFAFCGACIVYAIRFLNKRGSEKKGILISILCVLSAILIGSGIVLLQKDIVSDSGWNSLEQTEVSDAANDAADNSKEESNVIQNESSVLKQEDSIKETIVEEEKDLEQKDPAEIEDGFVLISGGTFLMGSPESENWRIDDETQHQATVSSFYMDPFETTQEEYARIMGSNPSSFSGENLPVESISWFDAVSFANAKSSESGLTPAYTITDSGVVWNRSANGYRLPTEAEWEYACRAGTVTPFNLERSLDADDANFYGHYPYEIEENYFDDSVLDARPGVYRQTTLEVGSFYENAWGLYDMHGNVNEWCWDYYGAYDLQDSVDPTGAESGTRHVYRGGGWNDFGKNMRSAYRAAGQSDLIAPNLGVRLVRNAETEVEGTVTAQEFITQEKTGNRILIAFFSWSGNTRGIAYEIQDQTGADLFEITLVEPYSTSYNTVLMEAQEDQHKQARPEIADPLSSIDEYDVILLGYPNWWASIPMPIASFLEMYDFSGKTIIPFCSHGGGRFGQSLTAIAKLAPNAVMGEGLSIHYSGGSSMPDDVADWLNVNGIEHH